MQIKKSWLIQWAMLVETAEGYYLGTTTNVYGFSVISNREATEMIRTGVLNKRLLKGVKTEALK